MKTKNTILASLIIAGILVSCKTSKETTAVAKTTPLDCSAYVLTYSSDIKPIFETKCTKCHNTNNKAGYNFFTLESIKKAAKSGQLVGTIKHTKGFAKMPSFAKKLDQATIDKIECWVNNGMKE